MKHFKQSILKAMLLLMGVLVLAGSSSAYSTYKLKEADGNREYSLTWNEESKTYDGTIPSGNNGMYFYLWADNDKYGWGQNSTDHWGFGNESYTYSTGLYKDQSSMRIITDDETKVSVSTENGNAGWAPQSIKVVPTFVNGEVIYYCPNAGFKDANAIFRAIFNDGTIVSCTPVKDNSGYYSFVVPKAGLTTVKIERGESDTNWWGNYTQEMTSSAKGDNNCITMGGTVSDWSAAGCFWTVYEITSSYNRTLFVGVASANRHQIQYENGAYQTYNFYVNEEDMIVDDEFGFRFYSEPNGGVWMGNDTFGQTIQTGIEYTTNGNKRYFIKETGAYAINVKSYDPEANEVVFTLTKLPDDAVVRPALYIGGTWSGNEGDNTAKTRIESSKGKYAEYKFTVTSPNSKFRFFSESNGGNWMGPVYTDNINVDAAGTLAYTTVGNEKAFNIAETGEYVIKVSDYIKDNSKVTFTLTKVSGTTLTVPGTLYMRNSRNNWENVQEMKYDSETKTFSAKLNYNADEDFSFQFYENKESNWAARGKVYRPGDNTHEVSIPANYLTLVGKYDGVSEDPFSAWQYKASNAEEITILVHFNKSVPTVEVLAENSSKNYYFIGDMNNWYSNEFDGNEGSYDRYGDEIKRGINERRWNADKDNWKFEYAGDGWYKFTRFPNQLFSGHFQIVSGGSWDPAQNEVYSHVVIVDDNEIKGGTVDNTYKAFKQNRITRDDIINETEYRVRKRPSVEKAPGSNLHTQCNAVENAELWFYPGNDLESPRIKLIGTPKDYFIFYNMTEATEGETPDMKVSLSGEANSEYWVRARINSGKPNTNNYFMAGIKYDNTTLPFYDINGNTGAHMNLNEGIDLAPYDLKNMSEAELNNLFFGNQDIIKSIVTEKKLPNGRDISGYDQVWVAKIPSGFENPAGTKYNMTFTKAMTEADRTSTRTITTRHLYFFPQLKGLHVHINTREIENLSNVERVDVAYRIYKTDNNYNTIAVLHGSDIDNGRATQTLHERGTVIPQTAESASKEIGWYSMEEKNDRLWGSPEATQKYGYTETDWMVSWENEDVTTDSRREIPYDDNSAFVQFRMTIKLKQPINAAPGRRNEQISSYTVYVPERPDVANDDHHFFFDNNDLYVKTRAGEGSDGVWTGLREVLDEISGNVDPSSVQTVYYNLQGVRVDNPTEGGVYIRVRGDKSDKVLF